MNDIILFDVKFKGIITEKGSEFLVLQYPTKYAGENTLHTFLTKIYLNDVYKGVNVYGYYFNEALSQTMMYTSSIHTPTFKYTYSLEELHADIEMKLATNDYGIGLDI